MAHVDLNPRLTSFGATGRWVLLSSSLSTSMYLLKQYTSNKHWKNVRLVISAHVNNDLTHFSRMLSFSFWSASVEILFPWFTLERGHYKMRWKESSWHERQRCGLCVAEPHIERWWTELDVALDDKAHSLLHVSLGNRQGTASLRQATLRKHLQQVLLLGLPPRGWRLDTHKYVDSY